MKSFVFEWGPESIEEIGERCSVLSEHGKVTKAGRLPSVDEEGHLLGAPPVGQVGADRQHHLPVHRMVELERGYVVQEKVTLSRQQEDNLCL